MIFRYFCDDKGSEIWINLNIIDCDWFYDYFVIVFNIVFIIKDGFLFVFIKDIVLFVSLCIFCGEFIVNLMVLLIFLLVILLYVFSYK